MRRKLHSANRQAISILKIEDKSEGKKQSQTCQTHKQLKSYSPNPVLSVSALLPVSFSQTQGTPRGCTAFGRRDPSNLDPAQILSSWFVAGTPHSFNEFKLLI
jgi:hypothetical protein